ncbi:PaaI family thioesterase [Xylophilus sp. ASV27]|uniref:PaaI family thioesterase n=1 Tax=Xylophilus sp. ASV27 TaxID=2795129 RepID=UPI0018EB46F1
MLRLRALRARLAAVLRASAIGLPPACRGHALTPIAAREGVLAYLVDNALTYAGGSVLPDPDSPLEASVLTSEFKINYLRPAHDGERLVAVATVVGSGRTQAVCRCDVFVEKDGQRKLCAAAQGTIRKA